eukprot:Blabericola_migrator_1__7497@NODE_382_length_9143_cov_306_926399_g305_i0_p2_GENE_NODE_382_length_9143_cov_306_926399_g305_i0NODE_382_length_9143_cov_306_926399_g305_i0_p2_ORF_typecomplete_len424_score59_45CDC50/PF03381_15/2_8e25DUF3614/PF12267_8/0_12DUF423/PF04241_15/2_5DUF423/PF04241_15/56_NODE_382_length_9143_cov_306_926399_g305_i063777648
MESHESRQIIEFGTENSHGVWIHSQTQTEDRSGLRQRWPPSNPRVAHTEKVVITRAEVKRFGLRKIRRKIYRFRQQQFSHFMRLSSSFRRYNGAKLLAALGIALFALGIVLLGLTSETAIEIPYNDNTTITSFEIVRDITGPFFVYAHLTGFYANGRKFMESKPSYGDMGNCGDYDTVDAAFYVRPPESLPELQGWNTTSRIYPCGIAALTYFNDEIELRATQACMDGSTSCAVRSIDISTSSVAPRELFSLYTSVPTPEQIRYQWLDPIKETRYQGWMYSPFGPSVLILLGSLKDYTLYRGQHELEVTKNLWPAAHFDAQKKIVLLSFGSLGAQQTYLGTTAMFWGLGLILLSLLCLWALRRNIVLASTSLMGVSPEELREQWIVHATEWLNPGPSRPIGAALNRSMVSRARHSEGEVYAQQ